MSEKVHPIGEIKLSSTPFTNTDFDLVLIELKALRNEVAALKSSQSSQTAEINSLREMLIQQPSSQPSSSQAANHRQLTKHEKTVGGMDLANELYENRRKIIHFLKAKHY